MTSGPKIGEEQYIEVNDVLASTKSRLRIVDTSEYDPEIIRLVLEGARSISSTRLLGQYQCDVDIIDGKAKLPANAHTVIAIKPVIDPGISTDNGDGAAYRDWIYVNKQYLSDCGSPIPDLAQGLDGVFQIQGGFVLMTWPVPDNIRQITISYLGFAVNEETGFVPIPADYERALVAYASYQMLLAYPDIMSRQHQNLVPFNVNKWQTEYKEQRAWLQSVSNRRDYDQGKYMLKRRWKALFWIQNN